MAKITGPLHSDKASGSLGDCLTFSKRKSGAQVRFQRKQKIVTPSWGQADEQSLYRVIYARWLSLSSAQKQAYDDEAKSKNLSMSGWNLFLRKAMSDPMFYLGLVGYWSMNRAGFGTVLDLSKNGNVGTLKPTWPSNSPQYVDSKNKKLLKALSFDGVNDYVDCGNKDNLEALSNFTAEAWFKASAYDDRTIVSKRQHSLPWNGWQVRLLSSTSIFYYTTYSTTSISKIVTVSDLGTSWHHIVYTITDNVGQLYLDGVPVGTTSTGVGNIVNTNAVFSVGSMNGGLQFFNGSIDDVRIYNRALSAPEILNLYNMFK